MIYRTISAIFLLFLVFSCANIKNRPATSLTISEKEVTFQHIIEDTTLNIFKNKEYKSLAFGRMKIYKPKAFLQLDSIYAIKEKFLEEGNYRGLKKSGIEEIIPAYQAAAQEEIDQLQYEIEHIYQITANDSIKIQHSFYVFNYKDSLVSITPFYHFYVDTGKIKLFYDYQFNLHFLTSRDLYISKEEWEFFQLVRKKEIQLIRTPELQPFMDNLFHIMHIAHKVHSIDYRKVTQYIALQNLQKRNTPITIRKFHTLLVTKNKNTQEIESYQLIVEWENSGLGIQKSSTFIFSPYLKLLDVNTKIK